MFKISPKTKVYCIIGNPVKHSLSPIIFNAAFSKMGLDCVYLSFEVKNLKSAVSGIKALGIKGVNVTAPFKTKIISYLDELVVEANKIGAVNTIVNKNGCLIGYNTDGEGFLMSLQKDYKETTKNKNILLIGAGGAAKAIGWAISKTSPAKIIITNRTEKKAKELALKISALVVPFDKPNLEKIIPEIDIIINTIPIPLAFNSINSRHFVYDIVYTNKSLLECAKSKGAKIGEGTSMLLYQAAINFELWTNRKPPIEIMRKQILGYRTIKN